MKKIAILGGGMAGLSAAWQLTRTPELRQQHSVTVYQLGWRLGGKAASGRDKQGRNLEHGLHVWFGCYENMFQLLRELYAARTPPPESPLQQWTDVAKPQTYTPVGVLNEHGRWTYWPLTWWTNDDVPGDGTLMPHWWQSLQELIRLVEKLLHRAPVLPASHAVAAAGPPPARAGFAAPVAPTVQAAMNAATRHVESLQGDLMQHGPHAWSHLVDLVRWSAEVVKHTVGARTASGEHRMLWDILDVLAAVLRGCWVDLIHPDKPFESLDDEDFRAWLIRHGADPLIAHTSTVTRVLYDTMFQYVDGDVERPSYAAGTALGVIMRLLGTFKGSMMWGIQAGMGEAVVAPLYEALCAAGVHFRFFHKVTDLELSEDGKRIQTIRIDRQAIPLAEYVPIFTCQGLSCWPAEPFWEQLQDGEALKAKGVNFESHWCDAAPAGKQVLRLGSDFDTVVLAITLGAYKPLNDDPGMCDQLIARGGPFAEYVNNIGVVPSQAVQLWFDRTPAEMGWVTGKAATVSGPEYLNISADMSQVLRVEPPTSSQSLYYLTGTFATTLYRQPSATTGVPQTASDEVREGAIEWLNNDGYALWPLARDGERFDWSVLTAPADAVGEARFDAQFWRANIDPTECCTLSAAGTTKYRLHPDQTGFENLILAGEGTRHGFNTTTIEGAVMSGAAASRAICGEPAVIVGYDFLQRRPSQGPG